MRTLVLSVAALGALSGVAWGQSRAQFPDHRPVVSHTPVQFPSPQPISSPSISWNGWNSGSVPTPGPLTPTPGPLQPWRPGIITPPTTPGGPVTGPGQPTFPGHSGGGVRPPWWHQRPPIIVWGGPWGWWVSTGRGYWGWGWPYDYGYSRERVIYGIDPARMTPAYQPATQPAPAPATPPTLRERADAALASGFTTEAVSLYRQHLTAEPGDARATRMLGLALVAEGRVSDGASVVLMAYTRSPSLASDPAPGDVLGLDRVRDMTQRVVGEANRSKSASSWLTAAVLAQAEGREPVARTMIGRARTAGLDAAVADRFQASLGR